MRVTGSIFALDLGGLRTGFAYGPPGSIPFSATVILRKRGEDRGVALSNLIAFLQDQFAKQRPQLVVKEAPLPLEGFKRTHNSQEGVMMAYGLSAIVEGMCGRHGLRLEQAHAATIRKHFLGRANFGNREDTKHAVVGRCHVLGLMPREKYDEDRADALALWDHAAATYGNRSVSTETLHFFGERA